MSSRHEQHIRFECDCGARIKAPISKAGMRGKCNACGGTLTIPHVADNGSINVACFEGSAEPRRKPEQRTRAAGHGEAQLDIKPLLGVLGSIVLFIGPFTPIVSLPLIGSLNFFKLHWFTPTVFLVLAALSLVFSVMRRNKWVWVAGIFSAVLVAVNIIGYVFRVEITREVVKTQTAGDPFAGLAGSMAELSAEAMRLEWGIGILIIGTFLIIAAAAVPGRPSGTGIISQSHRTSGKTPKSFPGASEAKLQDIVGLLGKMREGIDKGVAVASEKSKEMLETTRIKRRIASLVEREDTDIEGLGELVYRMCAESRFDKQPLEDKCRKIAGLDEQIARSEQEIKQVQMESAERLRTKTQKSPGNCECGARIAEDAGYCMKCGAKVEQRERA